MTQSTDGPKPIPRNWTRRGFTIAGLCAPVALGGCNSTLGGLMGSEPAAPSAPAAPAGATVRVGLVLPLTAPGNGGVAATTLKNSAELALAQFQDSTIQLIVKDDRGTADGGRAAAQEAINEGAEIILGPLFAPTVSAAGQVAKAAGRPMIAFSTDTAVASRGIYLLSFQPESEVDRIVSYAVAQGRRSFAALVPDTSYGKVVEAQLQQTVSRTGARLVGLERYPEDREKIREVVARTGAIVGGAAPQADALLIPGNADALGVIMPMLTAGGYDPGRVKPLGTGLWNDPKVFSISGLSGGWFVSPEGAGFDAFAARYRQKYNASPTRIGTLAYDAMSLVVALARTQGSQRFAEATLTNPSGFSGADGVFRFRTDGTSERALAVLQIANGRASPVSPAPREFAKTNA